MSGSESKTLFGPLTNAGTIAWSGAGQWTFVYSPGGSPYSGALYNLPGGLFDLQEDAALNRTQGYEIIANAGTMRKSAGNGTSYLSVQLINTGLVDVESGTLLLQNGGSLGGQFTAGSGASINLTAGNFTSVGTPAFGGSGQSALTGGTLTLTSDIIAGLALNGGSLVLAPGFQGGTITNLTLSGATLISTNVVSGVLNWTAGIIGYPTGGLTVRSNGVLNVSGSAGKYLYAPLTNAGTVAWSGAGQWTFVHSPGGSPYSGALYNLPGGLFDLQEDSALNGSQGYEFIANAGTMRKSAGSGTSYIYAQLNNSGLAEADSGVVSFQNGFSPIAGELRSGIQSLSSYGTFNFAGQAKLGGIVGAVLLGGYIPPTNSAFTLLTYGSYTGLFTALDLPAGVLWATNYAPQSFTLSVAATDKLGFTAQPVGGVLTNTIIQPVVVQVEHPIGDAVPSAGVPITISLAAGFGAVHGTLTQITDSSGKAVFNNFSFDQYGTKNLLATAPNLTSATSQPFAIQRLVDAQWTSGGFTLQLNGNNNLRPVVIYASSDLVSWTSIYTNPPTTGSIIYVDSASTNLTRRFYRAVE